MVFEWPPGDFSREFRIVAIGIHGIKNGDFRTASAGYAAGSSHAGTTALGRTKTS
jgi:hypothetical protein